MDTQCDTRLVDDNEVVVVVDALEGDESTGLFGDVHCLDALSATVGDAVAVENRTFAEAFLRKHHDAVVGVGTHSDKSYNFIAAVVVEAHAAHTGGHTSHCPELGLVEADCTAIAVSHEDFGIAVGKLYADKFVALADNDGLLTLGKHTGVFGK